MNAAAANFAPGTRVRMKTPGWSGILRGQIVRVDADHYHARVNGRTVYFVQWNGGSMGSGWTADDLVAL